MSLRVSKEIFQRAKFYVCQSSAHIMFDDAMDLNDDDEFIANEFVHQLVSVIDHAARRVIFKSHEPLYI